MRENNQKHRPKGAAAFGGRPIGAPPKAAPVFLIILYHKCLWIFLICSLYIPYIYIYFLDMFHIFSLVRFLIYGVNRRQVLIAKPRLYVSRFYTFLLVMHNFIIFYFHIYFLNMFHILSLVCLLIYGVKRRQVLIAKPRLYLFFHFLRRLYFSLTFL